MSRIIILISLALASFCYGSCSCESRQEKKEAAIAFEAFDSIMRYSFKNNSDNPAGAKSGRIYASKVRIKYSLDKHIITVEAGYPYVSNYLESLVSGNLDWYTERGVLTGMFMSESCGLSDEDEYYPVSIRGRWNPEDSGGGELRIALKRDNELHVNIFGDGDWQYWETYKLNDIEPVIKYFNEALKATGKLYKTPVDTLVYVNESDMESDDPVIESAINAFHMIPDHDKVSSEARDYMTEDLYRMLRMAWELPRWRSGEIGNEEFLFYFVTGSDDSKVGKVESADIVSSNENKCDIDIRYAQKLGGSQPDEITSITLKMIKEGDKWLLDDFGNGVKNECKNYIRTEVNDYKSGSTTKYMKENQHDDWYTDEYISQIERAFKGYVEVNYQSLSRIMTE